VFISDNLTIHFLLSEVPSGLEPEDDMKMTFQRRGTTNGISIRQSLATPGHNPLNRTPPYRPNTFNHMIDHCIHTSAHQDQRTRRNAVRYIVTLTLITPNAESRVQMSPHVQAATCSEEHGFHALHDARKSLNHNYSPRPFTKDNCRMIKHVIYAYFWTSNQSACLMTAPPLIYSDNTDTNHCP
jgi:hypothetical protein